MPDSSSPADVSAKPRFAGYIPFSVHSPTGVIPIAPGPKPRDTAWRRLNPSASADFWLQVERLFAEASDLPAHERHSWLSAHCTEPEILHEVQSLLHHIAPETHDLSDLVVDAASALSRQPTRNLLGQTLGNYRITGLLGRGGMGEIYAAEDLNLGRRAALKLLYNKSSRNPDGIKRFRLEARAASALNHPNIVTIYDFGESDGNFYIASELVEGRTFRQLLSLEPLPPRDFADIALQIAEGLAAAHAAGIIHRDIKPENLMLRPDGYVKILDFGLAKLHEVLPHQDAVTTALTMPGMVMGTVQYMSPEQARGKTTDARSDLFSFGAVLYELLSRQPAFSGETPVDILAALVGQQPAPLTGHPPAITALIAKCLQKDPALRPTGFPEVISTLQAYLGSIDSGQVAVTQNAKRRRWPLAAAAGIILAAAVTLPFTGWFSPEPFRKMEPFKISLPADAGFGVISPDGRYLAYTTILPKNGRGLRVKSLISQASSNIEVLPPAQAAIYSVAVSPDSANIYYTLHPMLSPVKPALWRVPLLGGTPVKLADHADGGIIINRDGTRVAFFRRGTKSSSILVLNPDGSGLRELPRVEALRPVETMTWDSSGKRIFYCNIARAGTFYETTIFSVDPDSGTPRQEFRLPQLSVSGIQSLPGKQGFLLIAADPDNRIGQLWHLPLSGIPRRISRDLNPYSALTVSARGDTAVATVSGRESQLWLLDATGAEAPRQLTDIRHPYNTVTWMTDGTIISTDYTGSFPRLAAIKPGQEPRLLTPELERAVQVEADACPDRPIVIYAESREGKASIWQSSSDGTARRQITQGPTDRLPQCVAGGLVTYFTDYPAAPKRMQISLDGGAPRPMPDVARGELLSPDGKLAISASSTTLRINDSTIRSREENKILFRFPVSINPVSWAPDGKAFVYQDDRTGHWELWLQRLDSSPARQLTNFQDRQIFDAAFSPDGRHIVIARGRIYSDIMELRDVR